MALGRRVPPVMVGIVLQAGVSLSTPLVCRYYLVFALPIAALVLRDPDGPHRDRASSTDSATAVASSASA
jgi:hypothetical protein